MIENYDSLMGKGMRGEVEGKRPRGRIKRNDENRNVIESCHIIYGVCTLYNLAIE